jgi:hypothetical protein
MLALMGFSSARGMYMAATVSVCFHSVLWVGITVRNVSDSRFHYSLTSSMIDSRRVCRSLV